MSPTLPFPVRSRRSTYLGLLALGTMAVTVVLPACGSKSADGSSEQPQPRPVSPGDEPISGDSEFISAPPGGSGSPSGDGFSSGSGGSGGAGGTATGAPPSADGAGKSADASGERKVEETDLYRLDGDRLYYLNAYRGLMIFDVKNVDAPKLIGRSAIYGYPVEMIVRDGIASVVVSDWYGRMDDGTPFHGSIVRGIDARDPANIKITGEAKLGGSVRDTRIVGDVLYAVSQDYGWGRYAYWDDDDSGSSSGGSGTSGTGVATPGSSRGANVVISAVSIKGGAIKQTGYKEFPGWGGVFNVTQNAILLGHDVVKDPAKPWDPVGRTELQYVDISDPAGKVRLRGAVTVNGHVQGWGADNGRWNIDFADGKIAHSIGSVYRGGPAGNSYIVATADFTNPDAPTVASELEIPATGWNPAARFDNGRMYLSPTNWWGPGKVTTPFQVYDLANPTAPKLAGTMTLDGYIWLFIPNGNRLFALGNEGYTSGGNKISLRYLDVTDATKPTLIGTSTFGEGWAWTPAAGTFKAFTKDADKGLVVLPYSGWDYKTYGYHNGVQLIEFNDKSLRTAGAANTRGWVERGIFVKNRLVSLSNLAMSVIDYADRDNPKVVTELTLARNVVDARPQGDTIAELSTDWWGNDNRTSDFRVLPVKNAEENVGDPTVAEAKIDGNSARAFRNGSFTYVVTRVQKDVACPKGPGGGGFGAPSPAGDGKGGTGSAPKCYAFSQQVQIVDTADGKATLRGKVTLPYEEGSYYGWYGGWYGWYGWWNGDDVVQVGGDALALRRWSSKWSPGPDGKGKYETKSALYVVDLKAPDAPTLASTTVTKDPTWWWGNMRAIGSTLYTTHYEWISKTDWKGGEARWFVKYYLDQVDLTDRTKPTIGKKINVPGVLVGGSERDPSLLYTINYRWDSGTAMNELAVVKVKDDKAYLQGKTTLSGWVGNVFVRGTTAYASAQEYTPPRADGTWRAPRTQLHQVDLSNPKAPVDRVTTGRKGWGWLAGVEGDRAIVSSGWAGQGVDIYKLSDTAAPTFDQFVRTRGYWMASIARQGGQLFVASSYYGVQTIDLK